MNQPYHPSQEQRPRVQQFPSAKSTSTVGAPAEFPTLTVGALPDGTVRYAITVEDPTRTLPPVTVFADVDPDVALKVSAAGRLYAQAGPTKAAKPVDA